MTKAPTLALLLCPIVLPAQPAEPAYVGSAACRTCHPQIYARWSKTRMANVVRDPKQHPDAIVADFSKPAPAVNFSKDDIAFVYGSKWKQRFFKKVGDDYFPLGAQWDIEHKRWSPYFVRPGTDWWVAYYPADNMKRPTGPTCDGCHSVNYNVETKQVTEWNVGCEKCHGPGGDHVRRPSLTNIVNPARLDPVDAANTCIQCHFPGTPAHGACAGESLGLACRLRCAQASRRLLATRRAQTRRDDVHSLRRRYRP